jgi:hypothetical protein
MKSKKFLAISYVFVIIFIVLLVEFFDRGIFSGIAYLIISMAFIHMSFLVWEMLKGRSRQHYDIVCRHVGQELNRGHTPGVPP